MDGCGWMRIDLIGFGWILGKCGWVWVDGNGFRWV